MSETIASHLGAVTRAVPDRAALIVVPHDVVRTYRDLDDRSRRVAGLLSAAGLRRGDHIAYALPNGPEALEVAWGAQRCGLYYTPVSTLLTEGETDYLISDCDARAVFRRPHHGRRASTSQPTRPRPKSQRRRIDRRLGRLRARARR